MANDLLLNLPEGCKMRRLQLNPDFDRYNETLQRVVTYLLLHEYAESRSGFDLAWSYTTGALSALVLKLNERAKEFIQQDRSEGCFEISSINVSGELTGTNADIYVTITQASGDTIRETFTI